MSAMSPLGVYISVPFCRAKCSFCNFASGVSSAARIAVYVDTLCEEIDASAVIADRLGAVLPRVVDTVYFGGGTPSLLAPSQMQAIFAALRRSFDVTADAEITMEAAPGQISDEALEEAIRLGVNRVSLGVQSFVDRESAAVGRTHTRASCLAEIARLQAAGISDIGVDLIAGLPYQTAESWSESLETAVSAGLTHLSVYMLEVDEDSRLGLEVLAGGVRYHAHGVPSDEVSAALYEQACGFLAGTEFQQYEISNFARAGRQSRHNRKYWQRAPYFGFGLDAHSMLLTRGRAVRFANPDQMRDYDDAAWGRSVVRVGDDEAFEESLFLGLRLREGVDVSRLRERFGSARLRGCESAARELIEGGLMSDEGGRWTLTLRGRMVSNEVFGRLLEKSEGTSIGAVVQLREEMERAFGWRKMPDNVIDEKPENLLLPDSDILDALWFAGRDWRDITVEEWRQHYVAHTFMSVEAYRYYLPSVMLLSAENLEEWVSPADSLIRDLDRSPSVDGWNDYFKKNLLGLRMEEYEAMKRWLLFLTVSPDYSASWWPHEGLGVVPLDRAFDTVTLLERESGAS